MTKDEKIQALMNALSAIGLGAEWNAKTAVDESTYNEFMALVHIAEEAQARVRGE